MEVIEGFSALLSFLGAIACPVCVRCHTGVARALSPRTLYAKLLGGLELQMWHKMLVALVTAVLAAAVLAAAVLEAATLAAVVAAFICGCHECFWGTTQLAKKHGIFNHKFLPSPFPSPKCLQWG